MADKLMVVIPCYNEEEVLPETSRRLVEKMAELTRKGLISPESRVLLVDDGSPRPHLGADQRPAQGKPAV